MYKKTHQFGMMYNNSKKSICTELSRCESELKAMLQARLNDSLSGNVLQSSESTPTANITFTEDTNTWEIESINYTRLRVLKNGKKEKVSIRVRTPTNSRDSRLDPNIHYILHAHPSVQNPISYNHSLQFECIVKKGNEINRDLRVDADSTYTVLIEVLAALQKQDFRIGNMWERFEVSDCLTFKNNSVYPDDFKISHVDGPINIDRIALFWETGGLKLFLFDCDFLVESSLMTDNIQHTKPDETNQSIDRSTYRNIIQCCVQFGSFFTPKHKWEALEIIADQATLTLKHTIENRDHKFVFTFKLLTEPE
jgi:hypothetical protein